MNAVSLFRQNNPYEQLIQQMLVLERQPQARLAEKKSTQSRIRNVINDVDGNLSALHTLTKSFTDALSSPFDAKSATWSDGSGYSISAGNHASLGSHSLEVLRLAKTDTRISKQLASSDSELRTLFGENGTKSFSIEVAHPTEADPDHRVAVDVTVQPVGTTDAEILEEIRGAINTAMDDAVAARTIEKEQAAYASVVNETSDTRRLTLKSGQSGYANRLSLTDTGSDPPGNRLLEFLEIDAEVVAEGTGGGQVTAVGTSETDSELNSKFVLDGLTLYRDSNTVSDALIDTTVNLLEAGNGSKDFSVAADKDSIKGEVEDFIEKYNAIMSHLGKKMTVDADAGIRGDLAGDSTFRGLLYGLREDVSARVSGQPTDGPFLLSELGIEIQEGGTLKLDDVEELLAAVEKDAEAVANLFSGDDGVATRLQDRIAQFVGSGGILSRRLESIDSGIRRLDGRIDDWDDKLARREESLRMQFARMQETIATLQGQQQDMETFFGGGF